ncbi:MAG: acyl-CoA thioesterase II [Phenylobacterium sp.]
MASVERLVETFALERIEVNLFRGFTHDPQRDRIFGGQVISQALLAAHQTVEGRVCHSLHCYFIRPGDPSIPILFEVDRARDGGSFTTRRVVAIQHGQQIFNLAASYQADEQGLEHQAPMPEAEAPESMPDEHETIRKMMEAASTPLPVHAIGPHPVEIRSRDSISWRGTMGREPKYAMWFRAREPIGDQPHMHQVVMAYASDMSLLGTALRPHAIGFPAPNLQMASLDHAMWFHRPSNFNDWHLYVHDSPSASGGRGFVRGSIYTQDGTLVASVAQEGLIRLRQPKRPAG